MAEPHFSFVFPLEGNGEEAFLTEVQKQSQGHGPIDFEIRYQRSTRMQFYLTTAFYWYLTRAKDSFFDRFLKD